MVTAASEFRVNSETQFNQDKPVIATLADGSFVVAWTDGAGAPEATLWFQHFDAHGNAIGGQTAIAGHVALYEPASIAKLTDGGFVVTWQSYQGDIHMQRFAANGSAVGGDTQVSPAAAPINHQDNEAVTGLADGGWLVTWRSETNSIGYQSIYSQRYDANGTPVGQQPGIVESMPVPMGLSSVTSLLSGGYVVAWSHDGEILQRRYDAGGQPAGDGSPQVVTTAGANPPFAAALADGGWLVLYPVSSSLYAQRYDAAGHAVGGADLVAQNAYSEFYEGATVAGLSNGGYVITWETLGIGDAADIHAQRFDASGARAGGEFVVNTDTQSWQGMPSVTALQDGGFMVAWATTQDGMGTGISAARFDANGVAQSNPGWLQGDAANDTLQWDGSEPARLSGYAGNDTLAGGPGNDFIDGGTGNDLLRVGAGHDNLNGGTGVDTAVFDLSTAGVIGYSRGTFSDFSVSTANGTFDLSNIERAQFGDGLFALDTQAPLGLGSSPGGDTWWAASLWHLGFGTLPGMADLSRWTAQADQLGGRPGALAQKMVDTFAPGISNADLVTYLSELHAGTAPTDAQVQSYVRTIAPSPQPAGTSPWFATQGDFLAFVAQWAFNEAGLVGFTGSVQQLDPAMF
jgi:Ca2+-binding RTX toxin-like protein